MFISVPEPSTQLLPYGQHTVPWYYIGSLPSLLTLCAPRPDPKRIDGQRLLGRWTPRTGCRGLLQAAVMAIRGEFLWASLVSRKRQILINTLFSTGSASCSTAAD